VPGHPGTPHPGVELLLKRSLPPTKIKPPSKNWFSAQMHTGRILPDNNFAEKNFAGEIFGEISQNDG
jgi:hypothetical protein